MTSTPNGNKAAPLSPPPFQFGSPQPVHTTFHFQGNQIQQQIMAEMNRRVASQPKTIVNAGVPFERLFPQSDQQKEVLSDRFGQAHEKEFAQYVPS